MEGLVATNVRASYGQGRRKVDAVRGVSIRLSPTDRLELPVNPAVENQPWLGYS